MERRSTEAIEPVRRSLDRTDRSGSPAPRGIILVVDDHDLVYEGIRRVLEVAGFVALTTRSDRTAVALFHQHVSEIRAVLLDLRQRGESAREVFDAMRHLRPDLPVILMTGTPEPIARIELARSGLAGFLQEPFDFANSIQEIREALEDSPPPRGAEVPPRE